MPYSYDKLEDLVNFYVAKGYDEQRIFKAVSNDPKHFKALHASELPVMQTDVQSILAKHENYETIQKAINSELYMLSDQNNKIISYDPITHVQVDYGKDSLQKIMAPGALQPKLKLAFSEYEPNICRKIHKDSRGQIIFNRYNPPAWKSSYFYSGSPIEAKPIPPIYYSFLMSLLDHDKESYDYLINWIAISLKQKTMKMLGAIGKQRIGKGLLGQIIAHIHGYEEGNGTFGAAGTKFGARFNGVLDSRTFVEFSEFKVTTAEEKNNWKNLINTAFELEKKGLDPKMTANYANIFITANDMKDVKVGTGDQRLSLLNLTDRTLLDRAPELGFKNDDEVAKAVLNPANLADFAAFLWNYPVDLDMGNRVFQSKTLEILQKAQLTDWMKEFLCNYCAQKAGQEVKLTDVATWLDSEMNTRLKLKLRNFEELLTKLEPMLKKMKGKKYFEIPPRKLQEDGSKPIVLKIMPLEKQPPDTFLDNVEIVEES